MNIDILFPEKSEYSENFDKYFVSLVDLHKKHLRYSFKLKNVSIPIIDTEEEPEDKKCGKSFEDIVYYKDNEEINCILVSEAMKIIREGGKVDNKVLPADFMERYRIIYRDTDDQLYDFSYIVIKTYIEEKIAIYIIDTANFQDYKKLQIINSQSGNAFKPEFLYSIMQNIVIPGSGIEKEYFTKPYSKIFVEKCDNFSEIIGVDDSDIIFVNENNKTMCYPIQEVLVNIDMYTDDFKFKYNIPQSNVLPEITKEEKKSSPYYIQVIPGLFSAIERSLKKCISSVTKTQEEMSETQEEMSEEEKTQTREEIERLESEEETERLREEVDERAIEILNELEEKMKTEQVSLSARRRSAVKKCNSCTCDLNMSAKSINADGEIVVMCLHCKCHKN